MSTREDVATVLEGLSITTPDGVVTLDAYPQLPDTIQPWTCWPVWVSTTWRSACIADETWNVLVVLPSSSADAWADGVDSMLEPVRQQLMKLGGVMRAEPLALALGAQTQTVPAVAYTLET